MPPPWLPSANLTSTNLPFPLDSQLKCLVRPRRTLTLRSGFVTNCASNSGLNVGSPIVIIEAPPALKTATSMPSLRANTGQVKAGDVGRVVARKPKDVWAVRLAIGTYLLDAKYFRPFDEEEYITNGD
ncbi:chlororespiratory reduction 42 [Carex littledalei]|uniref:Chlororespiratory reduction 42 n=1 Tax=Carex littledalei TaxID=544730 RepID=A0A833VEB6_9POAL|nr:chlororespiratory reduction 42 [Carex littledalei]